MLEGLEDLNFKLQGAGEFSSVEIDDREFAEALSDLESLIGLKIKKS